MSEFVRGEYAIDKNPMYKLAFHKSSACHTKSLKNEFAT